jgi:hypothetical protein
MSPSTDSLPALSVLTVAQWKTQLWRTAHRCEVDGRRAECGAAGAMTIDAMSCIARKVRYRYRYRAGTTKYLYSTKEIR